MGAGAYFVWNIRCNEGECRILKRKEIVSNRMMTFPHTIERFFDKIELPLNPQFKVRLGFLTWQKPFRITRYFNCLPDSKISITSQFHRPLRYTHQPILFAAHPSF